MKSFSEITVEAFLEQAASNAPVPGGGGIAALAGALGGAMASMAASFTVGKPKYFGHNELMQDMLGEFKRYVDFFRQAVDDDARAFLTISEAYKLPKETDEEKAARKAAIDAALTASMQVPLAVVRKCAEAAGKLPVLAGSGNPNLLSDVEVAAIMLEASARAAIVNVYANSHSLKGPEARSAEREAAELVRKVVEIASEVHNIVESRG